MMRPLCLLSLFVTLSATAVQGATAKLRPFGGCGVLTLAAEPGTQRTGLVLYREPGLQRVAELDASKLPRVAGRDGEPVVAATGRRDGWTRVAYDDAGREAWLPESRYFSYLPWDEFLPGHRLNILPGLKKGSYAVRSTPADAAAEMALLKRDQEVRVLRVEEDWALLEAPMGWFRWRDQDGRLTFSLRQENAGEKR